jgi:hypothetical protein
MLWRDSIFLRDDLLRSDGDKILNQFGATDPPVFHIYLLDSPFRFEENCRRFGKTKTIPRVDLVETVRKRIPASVRYAAACGCKRVSFINWFRGNGFRVIT